MEEITRSRLASWQAKVSESITAAQLVLQRVEKDGVYELKQLKTALNSLRLYMNAIQKEIDFYMLNAGPTKAVVDEAVELQIQAEAIAIELQTLYDLNQDETKTNPYSSSKLPQLDMPKFKGDVCTFTQFWDRFEASIHKKDLSNADKFSHLVSCLEGEASKALEGFPITNDNYSVAVKKLHERFGGKNAVVDAHNQALADLPKAKETPTDCRRTLDQIETHLRVLETLGEAADSSHLRITLRAKFPKSVMFSVNLRAGKDPTVTAIREALADVISAMDEDQPSSSTGISGANTPPSTTAALHVYEEKGNRKRKMDERKAANPKRPRREVKCGFCSESHYPDTCTRYKTLQERQARLKKEKKCFRCIGPGHISKNCKVQRKCAHCQSNKHHRALCKVKIQGKTAPTKQPSPGKDAISTSCESKCLANINRLPFLQTAIAKVNERDCRLLLDSGSQRSYISSRLAESLGLAPDQEDLLMVYTFGSNKPTETLSPSVEVDVHTKRGITKKVRVNIVPHITERVPIVTVNAHPSIDYLADDDSVGESVDLLLGNDVYFSFIREERIKIQDHIYLVNSDFGWLISGHTVKEDNSVLSVVTYCQCHQSGCPYFTEPDLPLRDLDMRFLWSLESIGINDSPKTTREDEAVKVFNETTKFSKGRYEVKWPWVQYPPDLPTNYGIAYGRLKGLLKKCDEQTLTEYNAILQEQLEAGIIEAVPQKSSPMTQTMPPIHYLPHHMVKQNGKRGRLVYDASAKLKNEKSLNECMFSGPSMLEDLTGLLLKFRMGRIGISADVEKAFLQVGLQEEDRDVTRFLWVKDPLKELTQDNLVEFRFTRVCFGIIASPFLLAATIRFHMARTNKALLSELADRCYVDNLILSVNSQESALRLYEEARKVFGEISMNIRDWTSNDTKLLQKIPTEQKAKQTDTVKVLGLTWDLENDHLKLNMNKLLETKDTDNNIVTKKDVLRTLARLYDPCGFVSPAVMGAKLVFQELCVRKLKWDSPLSDDLLLRWKSVLPNMKSAKDVNIPRYVGNSMPEGDIDYELHCFCDASKDAYAAVVYLRMVTNQKIETAFIMSKARVTPHEDRQDLKIPRLELLAFLIGNRLLKYVQANLGVALSRLFLWTDSQIVLAWMKSNKLLPPFVQRRVNEIRLNKEAELHYVSTKENPADIATRPELWQQKQELWFCGPEFLTKAEEYWPKKEPLDVEQVLYSAAEDLDAIDGPEMTMKGYEQDYEDAMMDDLPTDFEFCNPPIQEEPDQARISNIKRLQAEFFPREVSGEKTSLSKNLDLFMDVDGLLRSKGRMANTAWSYDMKHPVLIPKDCNFTFDIIRKIHEDNYHVGVSHTLMKLREKYWIPHGRSQVQKVIKRCEKCIKHGGGPYMLPAAPDLPRERVTCGSPFDYSGVDYFGPLFVNTPNGKEKRWVCLITCLAVRAVHLEVVRDMTAEECLLALRRFIAARGLPKGFISDNAMYFKLVSEILSSPYCKENMIQWKFIPQLAPWHGGYYERLVGIIKQCMKRSLDNHLLNEQQLMTIIKEVETVINSRPLTCVGAELEQVLKPSDFLSLKNCLTPTPSDNVDGRETSTKIDLIGSWRKGNIVLNEFKKMFANHYLTSLRERYNHSYRQPRVKSSKSPRVGDMVQIKDDLRNRNNWKVGKISSLIQGTDGQCRVARVTVGDTEFTRSLGHLYPLEADVGDTSTSTEAVPYSPPIEKQSSLEDIPLVEEMETDPDEIVAPPVEQSGADVEQSDQAPHQNEEEEPVTEMGREVVSEHRARRVAAIRAREKMAEWTRQLVVLLASL